MTRKQGDRSDLKAYQSMAAPQLNGMHTFSRMQVPDTGGHRQLFVSPLENTSDCSSPGLGIALQGCVFLETSDNYLNSLRCMWYTPAMHLLTQLLM